MDKIKVLKIFVVSALIGLVFSTSVFSQSTNQEVIYYVQEYMNSEYDPAIALFPDNTFTMIVNLFSGMGKITGTFQKHEDSNSYSFNILNRNYRGFTCDNVMFFSMDIMDNGSLIWSGSRIGATFDRSIFNPSLTVQYRFF